jgi:arabinogalactan endo-1,4-beta-galactosidase
MNKKEMFYNVLMTLLASFGLFSCSTDKPGEMPDQEPAVKVSQIPNGNFEQQLQSWQVNGDGISVGSDGCDGSSSLVLNSAKGAIISLSQTVSGLADGYYDVEFYGKSNGGNQIAYVEAGGKQTAIETSATTWKRHFIRGVQVNDGKLDIKIEQQNSASDKALDEIDGLKLISSNGAQTFIKGGDVSELTYVEDNGGKYYDADGKAGDCLDILKANGINLVRLRLYNDPGNSAYFPSNRLPKGYEDENDILRLAKRAKEKGMQIELTFHYSDYWTNGGDQYKPHAWQDIKDLNVLQDSVYQYTKRFLNRMNAQGTAPEYVSLGNEIQAGILYDYKNPNDIDHLVVDSASTAMGHCLHMPWLSQLLNAGAKAVREADPEGKIILHLNGAGDKDVYNWFFDAMRDNHVDYDIIGASYYPFWVHRTAKQVCDWAEYVTNRYDKDLLFMETGYAWNPTLPDGTTGQLSNNDPYKDMTKEGQKNFILELSNAIKSVSNQRVLGYIYWDPIFINTPGIGWILGDKNYVSNTTLFGFDGTVNPVMDAIKHN